MPELGTSGSARGVCSNAHPYRDKHAPRLSRRTSISSHARKRGSRACAWLEQGATGGALAALGSRFRGNDGEGLIQWRISSQALPPFRNTAFGRHDGAAFLY